MTARTPKPRTPQVPRTEAEWARAAERDPVLANLIWLQKSRRDRLGTA
ncbi:hypothetical protein [Streptomyces sp. NPDC060198]